MPETFDVYRLYFERPLHIGDHRPDDYANSARTVHSDTMYAALMAIWARLGIAADVLHKGVPPFVLSSLFPFRRIGEGEDGHRYFFPRPRLSFARHGTALLDPQQSKALKKVQWLDQHYFETLLRQVPLDLDQLIGKAHDAYLSEEKLPEAPIKSEVLTRVAVPRDREGSAEEPRPFYMERLYFAQGAGLYCLFEGDAAARELFEKGLNLLAEEGLGTDRSVGQGQFRWERGQLDLSLPDAGEYGVSLGLLTPGSKAELESWLGTAADIDGDVAVELLRRGGWITSESYLSIRKKGIYMLKEGSYIRLPVPATHVLGFPNCDLRPDDYPVAHPIWRCGRSFVLPAARPQVLS